MKRFVYAAFILLLVVGGCSKKEKPAVVVNGVAITDVEVQRVLTRKMKLLGQAKATPDERRETMDSLVDRKLLCQEGIRIGILATAGEVEAEMKRVRAKFPDENAFMAALKEEGLDRDGFKREIVEGIVVRRMEERLGTISPPDETEAKRYFEGHKADFQVSPKYRVYLVQTGGENEARQLLQKFRRAPAAFDRESLEKMPPELRSINRNAILTPRSDFPDEMHPFLDRLKPGELGGPVKSRRGWFVFRLLEKTDGVQKSWEQAKREISHMLFQERRENAVKQWLAGQRAKATVTYAAPR